MGTIPLVRQTIEFTRRLLCFVAFLSIAMECLQANPPKEHRDTQESAVRGADEQSLKVPTSETREVLAASENDDKGVVTNAKAKAISGRWKVVHRIQDVLDEAPPDPPDYLGRLMTFDVQIIELTRFWNDPEIKLVSNKIKQLAATRKHKIIGAGMLGGEIAKRPRAGLLAYFVLTQKEGETFVCTLNIDGFEHGLNDDLYQDEPWLIHYIAGKTRKRDLLLVQFDSGSRKRGVAAFQHVAEVPPIK